MTHNNFTPGTILRITATPDAGWSFVGWQGSIVSTNNPETFTYQGGESIVALFTEDVIVPPDPVDGLTIVTEGNGSVMVEEVIIEPDPTTGFPVDLFLVPETTGQADIDVTIPVDAGIEANLILSVFDADHTDEGELIVNDNPPILLFPGATQGNGDDIIRDIVIPIPTSYLVNGSNTLKFERLLSSGFRILSALVTFDEVVIDPPPPPPPSSGNKYAIFGDYGEDNPGELAVSQLVNRQGTTAILTTGDNNYSNGDASTIDKNVGKYFKQFISPYKGSYGQGSVVNKFHPTPGNHDHKSGIGAGGLQPYLDYFSLTAVADKSYYDFIENDIHFFCCDTGDSSNSSALGTDQELWLENAITSSTAKWKIVVMHHPPYSSGSHGDHPALQLNYAGWGVDMVICGHDHTYERIEKNSVTYIVTGLGGRGFYGFGTPVQGSVKRYNNKFGSLFITVSNKLDCQFVNVDDTVVDSFSVSKISPPPPGGYDFTVPGDFPDIPGIDWNQVVGKTGLISGTYQGNQEIDGADNVTLMFQNWILENGNDRGLNLDNSNNLTLKAVNSDPNNFRIRNFGGKHLRGERLNNLVVDGVWCETGDRSGQQDTIYIQRTDGFIVRNSKLIINAEAGGHNDIIQMFEVGGNVLIENNVGLQNNSKTTNNQGIYATTPRSTGNYKYLNNFISGTQKDAARSLSYVKNCLTLKRTGGSDVPIIIRGNKVRSNGYKFIWLNGITNYNSDIITGNDVDPNEIVIDG